VECDDEEDSHDNWCKGKPLTIISKAFRNTSALNYSRRPFWELESFGENLYVPLR
jgi:hypothetical protein